MLMLSHVKCLLPLHNLFASFFDEMAAQIIERADNGKRDAKCLQNLTRTLFKKPIQYNKVF